MLAWRETLRDLLRCHLTSSAGVFPFITQKRLSCAYDDILANSWARLPWLLSGPASQPAILLDRLLQCRWRELCNVQVVLMTYDMSPSCVKQSALCHVLLACSVVSALCVL
jgi:hypothetical protein